MYVMSAPGFRSKGPPIRNYIDARKDIETLFQRRTIAQEIRGRKGNIDLGKSLQMAEEILRSNQCEAQNGYFKLNPKIKQMITEKLKERSTIDSDASTTDSLSRENSEDSTGTQSDSAPFPGVSSSLMGLPQRRAIAPLNSPSLKLPRLR